MIGIEAWLYWLMNKETAAKLIQDVFRLISIFGLVDIELQCAYKHNVANVRISNVMTVGVMQRFPCCHSLFLHCGFAPESRCDVFGR